MEKRTLQSVLFVILECPVSRWQHLMSCGVGERNGNVSTVK
jgi:hypothetical protein